MENRLYIIRSEGTEHLCYKEDGLFVDICDDMFFFMEDADDFEVVPPGTSFSGKAYDYDGKRVRLIPRSYSNGLIALTLVLAETGCRACEMDNHRYRQQSGGDGLSSGKRACERCRAQI